MRIELLRLIFLISRYLPYILLFYSLFNFLDTTLIFLDGDLDGFESTHQTGSIDDGETKSKFLSPFRW
jgi:hypothetical protein